MTPRRTAWAGLGFAALLGLVACGGGDAGGDGGAPAGGGAAAGGATALAVPDPCALVTVEEVSVALGSPIDPPESAEIPPPVGGRTCLFVNSDAPPVKTFQVVTRTDASFTDELRANGQTVEKLHQDTRDQTEGATDVSGLGDQAFRTANAYYVVQRGVALETSLGLDADPSPEAQAGLRALTETAVSRL